MKLIKRFALVGCVLVLGAGAAMAGINSKEVGALLVYPEYIATDGFQTYITITNDKSSAVNAHIEVVGAFFCGDCNFDLPLTGFQTKRLRFSFNAATFGVVIEDASVISTDATTPPVILAACPENSGFVVVTLEAAVAGPDGPIPAEPRQTLGENMLHGDEVVVDLGSGDAVQVGAIAVQGVGPNDGDRHFRFDNMEYAAWPSIVTGNFWSPNAAVAPLLILFNVNFATGTVPPPINSCSINYVNAEEDKFSSSFNFGCWTVVNLLGISPGFDEAILGTANGFLWLQCDPGTHGALWTFLGTTPPPPRYPYNGGQFKDTLFQSVTTSAAAELWLTPDITGTP